MTKNNFGDASQQLFNQFLYRLNSLSNKINICQFTKPSFFTYPNYEKFRNEIFKSLNYEKGFVVNANEFDGVQSWPLTFSILKSK
jgi:hypothetical protein